MMACGCLFIVFRAKQLNHVFDANKAAVVVRFLDLVHF
jgi:hypothetical protein